ncbi:MAG: nuclear transport factor 2 family protein [Actinomycetota bacterium]|nr:nuclear transport factor 2 family protein [Actinomycetota bacterium]
MSDNGDVIRQAYDAFARGDIPGVIDLLADDVDWSVPDLVPQGGSFTGKEGATKFFHHLGETYEELGLDISDLVDGDSSVAGVGVARGTLRSGGSVEYGFTHVFNLDGGKVTRFREYVDRKVG